MLMVAVQVATMGLIGEMLAARREHERVGWHEMLDSAVHSSADATTQTEAEHQTAS